MNIFPSDISLSLFRDIAAIIYHKEFYNFLQIPFNIITNESYCNRILLLASILLPLHDLECPIPFDPSHPNRLPKQQSIINHIIIYSIHFPLKMLELLKILYPQLLCFIISINHMIIGIK